MSTKKHTPGPWRITRFNGIPNAIMAPHPDLGGLGICILSVQHEIEANAHVIAAAPELLLALTSLVDRHVELVSCGDCGNWDVEKEEAIIAARAAIASAESQP